VDRTFQLTLLDGTFAVCRLPGDAPVPEWFSLDAPLSCALRRDGELSLVCAQDSVPRQVRAERGWRALTVDGTLELDETGVLSGLAAPLAAAGVPLFALASFDTDHLLVPGARLPDAVAALREAGHRVDDAGKLPPR
jgi:hypothetical protein